MTVLIAAKVRLRCLLSFNLIWQLNRVSCIYCLFSSFRFFRDFWCECGSEYGCIDVECRVNSLWALISIFFRFFWFLFCRFWIALCALFYWLCHFLDLNNFLSCYGCNDSGRGICNSNFWLFCSLFCYFRLRSTLSWQLNWFILFFSFLWQLRFLNRLAWLFKGWWWGRDNNRFWNRIKCKLNRGYKVSCC